MDTCMKPDTQTLSALPWLAACGPAHCAVLCDLADLARIGPGEQVFPAGAPLTELPILLTGHVAETLVRNDTEIVTDIIAPVAPIGLAAALLGGPSPTGARTISSARLLMFPVPALRMLIRDEPSVAAPLLDQALAGLQAAGQQVRALKLLSAAQRLADFLLGLVPDPGMSPARFVLPYEKRHLAARIGCSQENLSRAFATLRRLGVETQRGVVVLRDGAGLRAFAGLQD
jgi:CRP/FNR family transcriptional activator FtrB